MLTSGCCKNEQESDIITYFGCHLSCPLWAAAPSADASRLEHPTTSRGYPHWTTPSYRKLIHRMLKSIISHKKLKKGTFRFPFFNTSDTFKNPAVNCHNWLFPSAGREHAASIASRRHLVFQQIQAFRVRPIPPSIYYLLLYRLFLYNTF